MSEEKEVELPNIGVGRALVVILILHVIAIGAIYVHSLFTASDEEEKKDPWELKDGALQEACANSKALYEQLKQHPQAVNDPALMNIVLKKAGLGEDSLILVGDRAVEAGSLVELAENVLNSKDPQGNDASDLQSQKGVERAEEQKLQP